MGMGSYGRIVFTEAEFDAIINYYRLLEDSSKACWRKFDADIESSNYSLYRVLYFVIVEIGRASCRERV